jgi:hypothetical protein
MLRHPRERVRDLGEDVETHGGSGYLYERRRHDDATGLEIDGEDGILDHRHERAGRELEIVVRDARQHVPYLADLTPCLVDDREPDELEDVEMTEIGGRQVGPVDGQLLPALDGTVELDRTPVPAHTPGQDDRRRLAADE